MPRSRTSLALLRTRQRVGGGATGRIAPIVSARACVVFATAVLAAAGLPDVALGAVDQVHYTFTGPRSVAFDWRGPETDLRYGTTSAYGSSATASAPDPLPFSSPGPFREVELTGLEPGTTYHYSIGGGPDATFTTAPTAAFRFDAIADSGSSLKYPCTGPSTPPSQCPMIATQAQVAADDPDFVLAIGDLAYGDEDGLPAVDQHFNDVMPWSRTAAYMPAWGNHEWEASPVAGDDLSNYKGRFKIPNGQASVGLPGHQWCCGEDWGWFDAGGVRFVSYPEPYAGGSAGTLPDWSTKADAVMAAAQADDSIRYIVTFGHQPAYSTGSHSGVARLSLYLGQFGDRYSKYVLNLNAHSHNYERFQPIHGVTHVTAAGGGSELGIWTKTDPRTVQRALNLERVRVDVDAGGLRVQTICGPPKWAQLPCAEHSVIDEFTIAAPRPAPVVALTQPAHGSMNPDQSFAGTAGTATGDSRTVDVRVHEGENTDGPLAWTASPTIARSTSTSVPDTTTGTWFVSAVPELGDGTYTVVARQSSSNGDGASQPRTFQVDRTAPSSSASVPAVSGPGGLEVSWSAADAGPSGLAEVELWARPPGASGFERVATDSQPGAGGAFEYAPTAGEGAYAFFTRARDRAGNLEDAPAAADADTDVDATAPVTADDVDTAWHQDDVAVGLTATDTGGAGVERTFFTTDGSVPTRASEAYDPSDKPRLTGDGQRIRYFSVDGVGNAEPVKTSRPVRIDGAAPDSSASPPAAARPEAFEVPWAAADAGPSGLAEVELWARPPGAAGFERVATNAQPGASGAFEYAPTAGEGTYAFFTRARDGAGNVEAAPTAADGTTSVTRPQPPSTWTPVAPVELTPPAQQVESVPVTTTTVQVAPQPVVPAAPLEFTVTAAARHSARAVMRGGLPVRVGCSSGCTYRMALSVDTATARKLKLGRSASSLIIARSAGALAVPGKAAIKLRLAGSVQRSLRRLARAGKHARIKVTLGADVADATGAPAGRRSLKLQLAL